MARVALLAMAAAAAPLPVGAAYGLTLDTDSRQYEPGQAIRAFGDVRVLLPDSAVTIRKDGAALLVPVKGHKQPVTEQETPGRRPSRLPPAG